MNFRTETKLLVAFYLTLYLCLLAPLHLLHLGQERSSSTGFGQGYDTEHLHTSHNGGSCPTCQLGNGLIDLPSHYDFSSVFAPISILLDRGTISVPACESSRPTPRAPPFCG